VVSRLAYAVKIRPQASGIYVDPLRIDGAAAWIQFTDQRTPTTDAISTLKTAFPSPHP
jgi:hypothetical protein